MSSLNLGEPSHMEAEPETFTNHPESLNSTDSASHVISYKAAREDR